MTLEAKTYSRASNVTRIRMSVDGFRWRHPRYPILLRVLQILDELTCCRVERLCIWRCQLENESDFRE